MGASSTHPGLCAETPSTTGLDTVRMLFTADRLPERRGKIELSDEWVIDPIPSHGLIAAEGNPTGGALWGSSDVMRVGREVEDFVDDHFGRVRPVGVSRVDITTSRRFDPAAGRAFMAGLAAMELPRMEATRRGTPAHSVWWTGAGTAVIRGRAYCESFKVAGREPFERLRLEDQRRLRTHERVDLATAADPAWECEHFMRRWEPMRKAVDGVTAASFPVIAQGIADDFKYGLIDFRQAERYAASLVLIGGGAGDAYKRSTFYKRRAELRDAGYVVVEDFMEPTKVNLGDELERILAEFGHGA